MVLPSDGSGLRTIGGYGCHNLGGVHGRQSAGGRVVDDLRRNMSVGRRTGTVRMADGGMGRRASRRLLWVRSSRRRSARRWSYRRGSNRVMAGRSDCRRVTRRVLMARHWRSFVISVVVGMVIGVTVNRGRTPRMRPVIVVVIVVITMVMVMVKVPVPVQVEANRELVIAVGVVVMMDVQTQDKLIVALVAAAISIIRSPSCADLVGEGSYHNRPYKGRTNGGKHIGVGGVILQDHSND